MELIRRLIKIIKLEYTLEQSKGAGGVNQRIVSEYLTLKSQSISKANIDLVENGKLGNPIVSNYQIFQSFSFEGNEGNLPKRESQLNIEFKNDLDVQMVAGPNVPKLVVCDEQRVT